MLPATDIYSLDDLNNTTNSANSANQANPTSLNKCISSFIDIPINPSAKTLVICDIDDTILKPINSLNHFYQILKNDFADLPHEEIIKEARDMQSMSNNIVGFSHTDPDGFAQFETKVKESSGTICFLTARNKQSENFTKKNFKQIGLNYENYQVYYTNNIKHKGQYIHDHIDTSNYDCVIFIDDSSYQIDSVSCMFNHINCYKFVRDNDSDSD